MHQLIPAFPFYIWLGQKFQSAQFRMEKSRDWIYRDTLYIRLCLLDMRINYSWLSLSRTRLSRITAYLEVKILSLPKHDNLTTSKKYCGKEEKLLLRSNFSSFPQYFRYIKSPITYKFVKYGCSNYFSSILKIWYVEVWISRSVTEGPLEFEITRVDCIY